MTEIIAEHLPTLLSTLDTEPVCWWVRYHSPAETDHLRLRIRTDRHYYATYTHAVGEWAQRMRQAGMAGRLVIDTYSPEIGRYGHGAAMHAAEDVFVADSHLAATALRNLPITAVYPTALAVANLVGIVTGLMGDRDTAMPWLATRPVPAAPATDRAVTDRAIRLATSEGALHGLTGWDAALHHAWRARADTLTTYRKHLSPEMDLDRVVESLLHMHHNRLIGIDRDSERTCRRLARRAALAWRARNQAGAKR
jgi:thiopeptide-type bacteriocin biosynthesis protein